MTWTILSLISQQLWKQGWGPIPRESKQLRPQYHWPGEKGVANEAESEGESTLQRLTEFTTPELQTFLDQTSPFSSDVPFRM